MPNEHLIENVRSVIEWAALSIEILGAVVIFAGVLRVSITRGTVRFVMRLGQPGAYDGHKHQIGRSLLLGWNSWSRAMWSGRSRWSPRSATWQLWASWCSCAPSSLGL